MSDAPRDFLAMRTVAASLGRLVRGVVDPGECRRCGRQLTGNRESPSSRRTLCGRCLWQVAPEFIACEKCGAAVGPHLPTRDCLRCRDERWPFSRVLALGEYRHDALRRLILRAKPAAGTSAAALLGRLWAERFAAATGEFDAVVPVPRHWTNRIVHGSAASERVAEAIARYWRRPLLLHAVRKRRRTPRQAGLKPTQRRHNLRGAFAARRVDGLSLLLVDDILTTGSTAAEVTRALCDAGADHVTIAVIARAVGESSKTASTAARQFGPRSEGG